MHKELELHVSGCLDHEGVVDVIYTVVIYRSGGTCFDPKVNLGYPFGKHHVYFERVHGGWNR
jgi:hypothetical protein